MIWVPAGRPVWVSPEFSSGVGDGVGDSCGVGSPGVGVAPQPVNAKQSRPATINWSAYSLLDEYSYSSISVLVQVPLVSLSLVFQQDDLGLFGQAAGCHF